MKLRTIHLWALAWACLTPLRAELVGLYTFDDAAAPLKDESGKGSNLQSAGADPTYSASGGVSGGGYEFNGSQRLVAPININPDVTPKLTMGAWVKTSTLTPGLYKVLGHDNGGWDRTIGLDNRDGPFRFASFIGNGRPVVGGPAPTSTDQWAFFAATYDQAANQVVVYVDPDSATTGDALVAVNEPTGFTDGLTTVAIGGLRPDNAAEGWRGSIDNVFFYNEVLSADRMKALRDGGKAALLPPNPNAPPKDALIGFYTFDDPGKPLADSSAKKTNLESVGADPDYVPSGGFQGGAYRFDGAQRLVAPIDINVEAIPQLTMGAWVKSASLSPGLRKIMGHDNGGWDRTIGLDNREGDFRYSSFVGNRRPVVGTPGPKSTDDWTFVAVTYDEPAATVTVYVDVDASSVGDEISATSEETGFNSGFDTVSIGSLRPDNTAEGWNGLIDSVFFYNKVLTKAQITSMRDGGPNAILGIQGDDPNLKVTSAPSLANLSKLTPTHQATFKIQNSGASKTLNLTSAVIDGTDAAFYKVASFPQTLAPGAEGNVVATFEPRGQIGNFKARLTLATNDPSNPSTQLDLSASVVADSSVLLGLYTFDAANPLADGSGNGRSLTAPVAPTHVPNGGISGGGYQFDGTQRLVVPLNINPSAIPKLTMGAWVKTATLEPALYKVMGHDDGGWDRTIGLDNREGDFRYTSFIGNGAPLAGTPTPTSTDQWTFLAAAYDQPANEVTVYVDLDVSTTNDPLVATSGPTGFGPGLSTVSIGSLRPDNAAEGWQGFIDNAFFVQGELDAATLGAIRANGPSTLLALTPDPVLKSSVGKLFSGLADGKIVTRSFEIENAGKARNLEISGVTISGKESANFKVGAVPTSLAPGQKATIEVTLDPKGAVGAFVGALEIYSNDSAGRLMSVDLSAIVPISDPKQALIALYTFDDAANPFKDASGNGNHLQTADADPTYGAKTGVEGGAYEFDGSQRLIAPIDINPGKLPLLTMGAWVKTTNLDPGLRKVMGHDDGGWDRTIGLDNREDDLRYTSFIGTGRPVVGTPHPESTDAWTFLAVTMDEATHVVTVYVDLDVASKGDALLKTSEPTGFGTGFPTLAIGGLRPDATAEGWQGFIDNAFLYRAILTEAQLAEIRTGGSAKILAGSAGGGTTTTRPAPPLVSRNAADNYVLTWTAANSKLQTSTDLKTWTEVSPAPVGNTYTVPAPSGQRFYRVAQ